MLIVTQPNSEYNLSYSSLDDLNLIKLVPFGKVILRVGFLSLAIKVIFPAVTLTPSSAISDSPTPWPHTDFNSATFKISVSLNSSFLKIKSTL